MTDIVERLRFYAVETFALPIATVIDSAAGEIERLRAERRWIPVGERMPEDGKAVLVLDGCHHADRRFIGIVLNGEWCDQNFYILDGRRTPTHWMPLPPLPNDKCEL